MPMELDLSIRSIAKSIADDNKPENAEWNPNQPKDGALMETSSGIKWVYSWKSGS
jgi:hypothetical protein